MNSRCITGLTWIFWADAIQAPGGNGSASAAWRVRRFVF